MNQLIIKKSQNGGYTISLVDYEDPVDKFYTFQSLSDMTAWLHVYYTTKASDFKYDPELKVSVSDTIYNGWQARVGGKEDDPF